MYFREIPSLDKETVGKWYQHIDNGGYTVSMDIYGTLTISFGFFGYSQTDISLSTVDIDGLISLLNECKTRIEQEESIRRLKGE